MVKKPPSAALLLVSMVPPGSQGENTTIPLTCEPRSYRRKPPDDGYLGASGNRRRGDGRSESGMRLTPAKGASARSIDARPTENKTRSDMGCLAIAGAPPSPCSHNDAVMECANCLSCSGLKKTAAAKRCAPHLTAPSSSPKRHRGRRGPCRRQYRSRSRFPP